jgi:uncharacterized membrane protein YbhN (UPF0104 family)
MRKVISLLLKAAVSLLLLFFALKLVDAGTVASRLARIRPAWAAFGVLVLLAQTFLQAVRWRQIVSACGAELPLSRLFRYSMIAMFFNQTLPSSVGGDAMRIWLVGKQSNWRVAGYSVFLDRAIGVVALAVLVVTCLPWSLELVKNPVGRVALLVIGLGSLAAGLVFLLLAWERLQILQRWAVTRHLAAAAKVALTLVRSPRTLGSIGAYSLLIHLLTAVAAWSAARAVAADLSLLDALFLVLPVILVSIVPISIAGWGVREGAMVAAFAYAGLPQSDGLIVSLLFGAGQLAVGAIGGLMWTFNDERAEAPAIQAGE